MITGQIKNQIDRIWDAFWENKNLASIENMRREIRDLMKYLKGDGGKTFTVNIEDYVSDGGEAGGFNTTMTYREKLLDFLTEFVSSFVDEMTYSDNGEPIAYEDEAGNEYVAMEVSFIVKR